jgi:hypothetical protein
MISDLSPVMLSASAWQTLMTLIAPGGQMRLSPWIQAAQAKVVFKCDIGPQHREEDWRKLIRSQAATKFANLSRERFQGNVADLARLRPELAYVAQVLVNRHK